MDSYCIKKSSIRKLVLPKEYDINKIQIGIAVTKNEDRKIGLSDKGDMVLPDESFGSQCRKNAYGYTYADKSKPKENRYVSTNCIYPFGNTNASTILVDIYRDCYPKVIVPPYGIELRLIENENKKRFIVADLDEKIRVKYLKETVNIFLEIYGFCYIFRDNIKIDETIEKKTCNWEILPPGHLPSEHLKKYLKQTKRNNGLFDIHRLEYIEKYKPEKKIEGLNGFRGYYAYLFRSYCVLESAIYGNATYIIPENDWEKLSKKSKQELFDEKKIISRIEHTKKWEYNISSVFNELKITR